ncbi:DsbA family protein [Asticcacaulis sp. BYS171W]|uniref:DsbA family protein n=1 Tax=Asticcacaulis aquaticus TaxID=2984212 RepID=A0ABT5HUQ3_9CAUL|nr:DsbA family protein [Asticcacaulis aquaticus]MDC7683801.1 DsbA family protein [Asticcacaulis aquaticus]
MHPTRKSFVRNTLLAAAALAALALTGCGGTGGSAASDEDMTLGKADAPITLIEYASVTCVHCADFNEKVFPTVKKDYIDTGKVHYIYREFITGPADVSAAGILVARCAGKDKYFSVIDAIMRSQKEIFTTGDGKGVLKRVASSAGMSDEQFQTCVSDAKGLDRINKNIEKYVKEDDITGTPTLIINGEKFTGDYTKVEEFTAALNNAKPVEKK